MKINNTIPTAHKIINSTAMPSDLTVGMQFFMEQTETDNADEMARKIQKNEENDKKQRTIGNIAMVQSLESALPIISNRMYEEGKNIIFKDIVSNIYYESLYLDDDFKEKYKDMLITEMCNYIDDRHGFMMLEKAIKSNPTNRELKIMKNVVESTARKCVGKKTKDLLNKSKKHDSIDADDVSNTYNFSMSDEDVEEYMKERESLSEDQIVEFVKKKVLQVVKDEKNRETDVEELESEIKDLAEDNDLNEEQTTYIKESVTKIQNPNSYSKLSLFNAIHMSSIMESVLTAKQENSEDDDIVGIYEDDVKPDDDERILTDSDIMEENVTIDMDLSFAEAIAKYTLLETVHTLCLENFSRDDIQKMTLILTK